VYAVAVAAGGDNSCIIDAEGDVYCWGANGSGQLGTTSKAESALPLRIEGLGEQAVGVAVMDEAICALLRGGSVKCWGENFLGQLGRGSRELESSPAPEPVVFE
jgi:alpha-tubulin suppressor-like RCC1 family protein